MYNKTTRPKTSILSNVPRAGETIEQKLERITNNREPITDGAPLVYTDYKDGVRNEYNVRADKWDIAMQEQDKGAKNAKTKVKDALAPKEDSPETGVKGGTSNEKSTEN